MAIDATIREAVQRRGRARLLQGLGYALLGAGVLAYMEANDAPAFLRPIPIFLLATSSLAALRGAILFLAPELELHRLTPGANYLNLVLAYGIAGAGVGIVALAIVTQTFGLERADSAELAAAIALVFAGFATGSVVGVRAARRRIAALS